jgi:phosphate transport system protein
MKLYEARLQADLNSIRERVGGLADGVRAAVDEAVQGLVARNNERMYRVILDDGPYNRETRAIDKACHAFVARHVPAAGHLRFVSSVLRLTIGLERIGDYAVTICRVGVHLEGALPSPIIDDIRTLADQANRMLELSIRAFLKGDADLARETKKMAKRVDKTHDRIFADILEGDTGHSVADVARLLTVYDKLERVSDQAKNICEEAVFVTTGETKAPKVYDVLFVDGDGTFMAPLATALAGRAFPESGNYVCASLTPAADHDPQLANLSDLVSLSMPVDQPNLLEERYMMDGVQHVIVAINLEASELPTIPFHTVLQRWTVEDLRDNEGAKGVVNDLSDLIRDLMETLRGPDVS